jgi:hypothetical protein
MKKGMSVTSGHSAQKGLPVALCSPRATPWSEITRRRVLSEKPSSSILSRKLPSQRSAIVTSAA